MRKYVSMISDIPLEFNTSTDFHISLGGEECSKNFDLLKQLNIKTVINCASLDISNLFSDSFQYYSFPFEDNEEQNLIDYFAAVCQPKLLLLGLFNN